jgi:hypothetical protein
MSVLLLLAAALWIAGATALVVALCRAGRSDDD